MFLAVGVGYGSDKILQQEVEARGMMEEESELSTGQEDKEMCLYEPGAGPSIWLCLSVAESPHRAYIQVTGGNSPLMWIQLPRNSDSPA